MYGYGAISLRDQLKGLIGVIMKAGIKGGLTVKFYGAMLGLLLVCPAHAQLMLAHEGHHNGGGCKIETGDFPVTFSAYEVPEGNIPPMHSYCDHIPNPGKVNLTIELSEEARKIPLAVRLVKEGHEGHGAAQSDSASKDKDAADEHDEHSGEEHAAEANEHGIVYMPAEVYKSGIIVIAAELTDLGQHMVLLEKEDESGKIKTAVSIPLHVGGGGGHGSHGGGIGVVEIALALLVVGGAAFYFLRRKRTDGTPSA